MYRRKTYRRKRIFKRKPFYSRYRYGRSYTNKRRIWRRAKRVEMKYIEMFNEQTFMQGGTTREVYECIGPTRNIAQGALKNQMIGSNIFVKKIVMHIKMLPNIVAPGNPIVPPYIPPAWGFLMYRRLDWGKEDPVGANYFEFPENFVPGNTVKILKQKIFQLSNNFANLSQANGYLMDDQPNAFFHRRTFIIPINKMFKKDVTTGLFTNAVFFKVRLFPDWNANLAVNFKATWRVYYTDA